MSKKSAGILLYRIINDAPEIFLVHPGGPFWKKKDTGVWSIPKGEYSGDEAPLEAAKREFKEETGMEISGEFIPLLPVQQKSGKVIYAWALKGDIEADKIQSNTFGLEWPPGSGTKKHFPETDKAAWFSISEAREKIHPAQLGFIEELLNKLNRQG